MNRILHSWYRLGHVDSSPNKLEQQHRLEDNDRKAPYIWRLGRRGIKGVKLRPVNLPRYLPGRARGTYARTSGGPISVTYGCEGA